MGAVGWRWAYGCGVEGVDADDRPGKRVEVEMEVVEGGIPGVEDRDGGPNLTERRGVDARELASSTLNYPLPYTVSYRGAGEGGEGRTLNGNEGLSSAAFTAATLVFSSSPRGALDSHSSSEMDGLLLNGCGLLSVRA